MEKSFSCKNQLEMINHEQQRIQQLLEQELIPQFDQLVTIEQEFETEYFTTLQMTWEDMVKKNREHVSSSSSSSTTLFSLKNMMIIQQIMTKKQNEFEQYLNKIGSIDEQIKRTNSSRQKLQALLTTTGNNNNNNNEEHQNHYHHHHDGDDNCPTCGQIFPISQANDRFINIEEELKKLLLQRQEWHQEKQQLSNFLKETNQFLPLIVQQQQLEEKIKENKQLILQLQQQYLKKKE
jgi:hypothetical protein